MTAILRISLHRFVDASVQLVAKMILAVLFGPLGIDIRVRALVRFPAQRHRAVLDRLGFLSLVALNRSLHQRGIDDLTAARQIPLQQQLLLDLLEYLIVYASLRQTIPEQPYRLSVWEAAALRQIQETQEASKCSPCRSRP